MRGKMFGLNTVGSKMLQLLEAGRDLPSIASEMSCDFGICEDAIRQDLQEFVVGLVQWRLIEPVTGETDDV